MLRRDWPSAFARRVASALYSVCTAYRAARNEAARTISHRSVGTSLEPVPTVAVADQTVELRCTPRFVAGDDRQLANALLFRSGRGRAVRVSPDSPSAWTPRPVRAIGRGVFGRRTLRHRARSKAREIRVGVRRPCRSRVARVESFAIVGAAELPDRSDRPARISWRAVFEMHARSAEPSWWLARVSACNCACEAAWGALCTSVARRSRS